MCKWGSTKPMTINGRVADIDRCIYRLVAALNENHYRTVASCCGHGKQPGSIILDDDREIRIMTYEQAREVDKLFPPINGGE